jgi:hypothetical protein
VAERELSDVEGRVVTTDARADQTTMALQVGDWVRTESGAVGQVVHISRLTVFVSFPEQNKDDTILAYLESQLSKTDPPPSHQT